MLPVVRESVYSDTAGKVRLRHFARLDLWICGFTALGMAIRSVYALRYHVGANLGDQIAYVDIGRNFGAWWSSQDAFRTPGYPAFLALIDELGFGLDAARLAQAAAVTLSCLFSALTARKVFGVSAGRAAAVIGALYPPLISVVGPMLSEAVASALFAGALFALCTIERKAAALFIASLLLSAAILVRPNVGIVLPILVVLALKWHPHPRRWAVGLGAVVVPVCVVFGPWVGRNYAVSGSHYALGKNDIPLRFGVSLPVPRASGQYGAWIRDRDYFLKQDLPSDVRTFAQLRPESPWVLLKENLRERPAEQAAASAFWVRELWLWPYDDHLTYGMPSVIPWGLLLSTHFGFLGLSLAGLWLERRTFAARLVAAAVVLFTVPFVVFQSGPRLALPAIFILCLPAGAALARLCTAVGRLTKKSQHG